MKFSKLKFNEIKSSIEIFFSEATNAYVYGFTDHFLRGCDKLSENFTTSQQFSAKASLMERSSFLFALLKCKNFIE